MLERCRPGAEELGQVSVGALDLLSLAETEIVQGNARGAASLMEEAACWVAAVYARHFGQAPALRDWILDERSVPPGAVDFADARAALDRKDALSAALAMRSLRLNLERSTRAGSERAERADQQARMEREALATALAILDEAEGAACRSELGHAFAHVKRATTALATTIARRPAGAPICLRDWARELPAPAEDVNGFSFARIALQSGDVVVSVLALHRLCCNILHTLNRAASGAPGEEVPVFVLTGAPPLQMDREQGSSK